MGEVGPLKVSVPKPRPLGLVKRESVHFDSEETSSGTEALFSGKHETWARGSLALLSRSKTESDIKHEFRSMRDLQETLRQAALLNIVAAVNHDDHRPVDATMPTVATRTSGGGHFVGIKGASILGHPISRPATKPYVSASTGEGISINNFSHNLANSVANPNNMTTASHNSTLSQLLGQRPRTISIPRPRTQTDQGAFMHNSLLDAKEQLTNVTTFRAASRKEMAEDPLSSSTTAQDNSPSVDDSKGNSVQGNTSSEPRNIEFVRDVSCLRGTGFDIGDSNTQNKQVKEPSPHHNAKESNYHQNGDVNAGKKSKEQQRAHNVHQMQAMKRHITTNKKKELMKKLTDIAKCDVVDIGVPLSSADAVSAPPIIIMSQQKDSFPFPIDGQDTRVNRIKSMTSLPEKAEANVPSPTRIQSETLESMANYREAKKKAILNVEEDLRIESINGIDSAVGIDGLYRTHRDQKGINVQEDDDVCFSPHSRLDNIFSDGIIGKTVPPSFSPDVFELRPLEGYRNASSRIALADRRRPLASRRSVNQSVRDRLISPSPAVYEASFHRPKVHMTLVGQSALPSLSGQKTPVPNTSPSKPTAKRTSGEFGNVSLLGDLADDGQNKAVPVKPWGSIGKQPSANSPILRTEIIDHLQCVGLVNHRQAPPTYKKSVQKVNHVNKGYENDKHEFEYDDEEYFDDDDSSDSPAVTKNTAKYRKSKLYNAFRASEENLATLADNTSLVSEVMTSKTLFNPQQQPQPQTVSEETPISSARDPVNQSSKEPLYMGCSSRVSEKELRSQYHYVNEPSEEETKQGGQFKVMKAIDQDVYFDFQHKKYRKNGESPLNTAPNNPRMHFLKIKFGDEAKT